MLSRILDSGFCFQHDPGRRPAAAAAWLAESVEAEAAARRRDTKRHWEHKKKRAEGGASCGRVATCAASGQVDLSDNKVTADWFCFLFFKTIIKLLEFEMSSQEK